MAAWYYMANQTDRVGPIDDNAMRAAVQSDQIMHNTFVFKVGETEWKQARDFPDLIAMHKRASFAAASPISAFEPYPWLVGTIGRAGEGWGVEVTFEGASADEGKTLSGLFQQYHSRAFPRLPRIASGSRPGSAVFIFPPSRETPVNVFTHAPLASNAVDAFRSHLGGMASTLRAGKLGLWSIDPRLVFFAEGNFHVVPAFWLPAFAARKTRYQGAADGWRDNGSQPDADEYAIASACFHAATGKPYDPDAGLLPGDVFAGAAQWDAVLGPILRASLSAAAHDDPVPAKDQPQTSEQRQVPLGESTATPPSTVEEQQQASERPSPPLDNQAAETTHVTHMEKVNKSEIAPEKEISEKPYETPNNPSHSVKKQRENFSGKRKKNLQHHQKSNGKTPKTRKKRFSKKPFALMCIMSMLVCAGICWHFGMFPSPIFTNRYAPEQMSSAESSSDPAPNAMPAIVNPDAAGINNLYSIILKNQKDGDNLWKTEKINLANRRKEEKERLARVERKEKERQIKSERKEEERLPTASTQSIVAALEAEWPGAITKGDIDAVNAIVSSVFVPRYNKFKNIGLNDIKLGMTRDDLKKIGTLDEDPRQEIHEGRLFTDKHERKYGVYFSKTQKVCRIFNRSFFSFDPTRDVYDIFGKPRESDIVQYRANGGTIGEYITYAYSDIVVGVFIRIDSEGGFAVEIEVCDRNEAFNWALTEALQFYCSMKYIGNLYLKLKKDGFEERHIKFLPNIRIDELETSQPDNIFFTFYWEKSSQQSENLFAEIGSGSEYGGSSQLEIFNIYPFSDSSSHNLLPQQFLYKCELKSVLELFPPTGDITITTSYASTRYRENFLGCYDIPIANDNNFRLIFDTNRDRVGFISPKVGPTWK